MVVVVVVLASLLPVAHGLFAEDAGRLDFTVSTAGHGPVAWAVGDSNEVVVTSDATAHRAGSSCYVSARSLRDGHLAWRRYVCAGSTTSSSSSLDKHRVLVTADTTTTTTSTNSAALYTLDLAMGILRAWEFQSGSLLWETLIPLDPKKKQPLASKGEGGPALDENTKEETLDPAAWRLFLVKAPEEGEEARMQVEVSYGESLAVVARVDAQTGKLVEETSTTVERMGNDADAYPTEASCNGLAVRLDSDSGSIVLVQQDGKDPKVLPGTSPVVLPAGHHHQQHANDEGKDGWKLLQTLVCPVTYHKEQGFTFLAASERGTTKAITVTTTGETKILWTSQEGLAHITSAILLDASHGVHEEEDDDEDKDSKDNDKDEAAAAVHGLIPDNPEAWATRLQWTQRLRAQYQSLLQTAVDASSRREHAFGFVKVAVLLSESAHAVFGLGTAGTQRGKVLYRADLPASSGAAAVKWRHALVQGGSTGTTAAPPREVLAVSYTQPSTTADQEEFNMSIHWMCLDAMTGTVLGQGLVPLDESTTATKKRVVQLVPLALHAAPTGSCRQGAMIVLQDDNSGSATTSTSTVMVPSDDTSVQSLTQLAVPSGTGDDGSSSDTASTTTTPQAPHQLFTHVIDRVGSMGTRLTSFRVTSNKGQQQASSSSSSLALHPVGSTLLANEQVVAVAYPPRYESVHMPCTVLGDDSLLLKYLNPHLVVIVTMSSQPSTTASSEEDPSSTMMSASSSSATPSEDDLWAAAVSRKRGGTLSSAATAGGGAGQKRKPLGATDGGVQAAAASTATTTPQQQLMEPNLFVNVMDSVSGRLLHRVSHVQAAAPVGGGLGVQVLISENWVVYSFINAKTRRAELGVLSLYEGMIDSKGLSAFTTPEFSTTFSSLDARETQPVVLAKTYTMTQAVRALGMTQSKSGISSRKVIVATLDGQIVALDRKMIEPRRPVGQLKEIEKKEGLQQYTELIPTVSYMSLSYNQSIEHVTHLMTAPTDLESQSLVLAYGGPDVFWTRTSPSKGFDVLPDSFNRVLLTVVVVALLGVLLTVQHMAARKQIKQGWV